MTYGAANNFARPRRVQAGARHQSSGIINVRTGKRQRHKEQAARMSALTTGPLPDCVRPWRIVYEERNSGTDIDRFMSGQVACILRCLWFIEQPASDG